MNKICALDLDGVLVDFVGGACNAHSMRNPYTNGQHAGVFDIERAWGMTKEQFWHPLNSHKFWANLGWTINGKAILRMVEAVFGKDNVYLLSKPCESPESASGKLEWIQKNMPDYAKRYLLGPAKNFAAHSGAVLVDDNDENVADWAKRGGEAVLVPQPWNKRAGEDMMTVLAKELDRYITGANKEASVIEVKAGAVRTFETGAIRNLDQNKPDYEGFLSPLAIEAFGKYMHHHRKLPDGSMRSADNWQKGMPKDTYMKSGWRHFFHWWALHRGLPAVDETGRAVGLEEMLCALWFNVQGYLHELKKAELAKPSNGS